MISRLKELSRDLLLLTNPSGTELEVGGHFQRLLDRHDVTIDELSKMLQLALPGLGQQECISLPLEHFGILCSPFSVICRDSKRFTFIAEDLTFNRSGDDAMNIQQNSPELSEKSARIQALLDESSDPIFGFKEDGTYFYVNRIFAETLGYTKEAIIDKTIWDIFPEDEANKRFAVVKKAFKTAEIINIEVTIPLPDGDKHFLTTAKPFKSKAGEGVEFVICISKDITELRTTQEQLKTLKGLLPICSNCKKIKNNLGAWQQLEEYISHNSEAQFSHGICPDCVRTLYPDISLDK